MIELCKYFHQQKIITPLLKITLWASHAFCSINSILTMALSSKPILPCSYLYLSSVFQLWGRKLFETDLLFSTGSFYVFTWGEHSCNASHSWAFVRKGIWTNALFPYNKKNRINYFFVGGKHPKDRSKSNWECTDGFFYFLENWHPHLKPSLIN